jgi:hypothetical protein
MIGLFRSSIPGSSVAGVTSARVVQSLFFTAVSVVIVICTAIFRRHTVSKGSPCDETGGFFAAHPLLIPLVGLAVLVVLYVLWPRLKPKIMGQWRKAKQGAAIFTDWHPRRRRADAGAGRRDAEKRGPDRQRGWLLDHPGLDPGGLERDFSGWP